MIILKKLCYLSIVLCLSCSDDDDEKLVSLMEDDIDNGTSWEYVKATNHVGAVDASVFSSPDHSLKIDALDTQPDEFSFWYREFTSTSFPEGAKLILKAKVKTDNVTGDGVFVAMRCDMDTNVLEFKTTQNKTPINGSGDFKEYTIQIGAIPKNTNTIRVYLIMSGSSTGTAYFDEVTLVYKY